MYIASLKIKVKMFVLLVFVIYFSVTTACDNKNAQILVLISKSEHSAEIFPKLGESLAVHFPEAEFAVASYSRSSCFHVMLHFTQNTLAVSKLRLTGTDLVPIASAFKAIETTTTSHKIQWSNNSPKLLIVVINKSSQEETACSPIAAPSVIANQLKRLNIKLIFLQESTLRLHDPTFAEFTEKLVKQKVPLLKLQYFGINLDSVRSAMETISESHCELVSPPEPSAPEPETSTCDRLEVVKPRLQVAFILDRTETFLNFSREFASLSKAFLERLSAKFPESEFALTTFADFPASQMKHGSPHNLDTKHGCFKIYKKLTSDTKAFAKTADQIEVLNGGSDIHEYGLGGIFLTIADIKLGWSKTTDERGRRLEKIIILLTDRDTKYSHHNKFFIDADKRHEPRGDGSDNCVNSFIPKYPFVGDILKSRSFIPMAFVTLPVMDKWRKNFEKMGVDNFHISRADFKSTKGLLKSIEEVVTTTVNCIWETDPQGVNTYGL